ASVPPLQSNMLMSMDAWCHNNKDIESEPIFKHNRSYELCKRLLRSEYLQQEEIYKKREINNLLSTKQNTLTTQSVLNIDQLDK
ncbi:MAG: hypothetical protein ACKPKO_35145, partial [Candidatus Fonsibacter sp.]